MNDNIFAYDDWVDDFLEIPEVDQKEFIKRTLRNKKNLHIFGRYFFPHVIKGKNDVPQCHIDLTKELSTRKDSAIIFPRGFAKSTWEKIDTIHDMVYALEPVILYVGSTIGEASFHFESIKAELENNELLRGVYGDLVPSRSSDSAKWTNKHLETSNGVNLVARGAGKGRGVNIKNQRPTKIILDDIEDDEQIRSRERCAKLHEWLNKVIFPSLDKQKGFIKMIGTVLAKHAEVVKFYNKHGGIFRRAIEDGESIWPNFWSLEDLEKMRIKIGSRAFSQEYLNETISDEDSIIKLNWMVDNYYTTFNRKANLHKVIIIDPQAGESKTSDYYGISIVGYYRNDIHRYVMSRRYGRASKIDQAALVARLWQKYKHVVKVGVEKIMTQVAVFQILRDWKAGKITLPDVDNTNRDMPLIAVTPKGKDKIARLEAHEAAFERGEIHLHHTMNDFAEKIAMFPVVEHDDDIDALIYALDHSYKTSFTNSTNKLYTKSNTISGNVLNQQF